MRSLVLLAFLAGLPAQSQAQSQTLDTLVLGEETYFDACAGCHGGGALGDGPMAEILTVAVPDLTGLAARNGGSFPSFVVIHAIDGRTGLRGHGGPMPIFGTLFRDDPGVADGPDGTPVITSARVLALTDYLEELQKE